MCLILIISALTVHPQEVIEQLEEGETVPAVGRLNLKCRVHVSRVETQEGLGVLHHQVGPPGKGLQRGRGKKRGGEREAERRAQREIKRLRAKHRRQIRQRGEKRERSTTGTSLRIYSFAV